MKCQLIQTIHQQGIKIVDSFKLRNILLKIIQNRSHIGFYTSNIIKINISTQ